LAHDEYEGEELPDMESLLKGDIVMHMAENTSSTLIKEEIKEETKGG
jgi:hypothetical protein